MNFLMYKNILIPKQNNFLYEKCEDIQQINNMFDSVGFICQENNINVYRIDDYPYIWLKDIMPFENVVFKPAFSYLPKKEKKLLEKNILEFYNASNHWIKNDQIKYSDLMLDGGSIIKNSDMYFVSQKFVEDNGKESIKKLYDTLNECYNIIFIQPDPLDKTGHIDSVIRPIDKNLVLLNDYRNICPDVHEKNTKVLSDNKIDYILIPVFPSRKKVWGWYSLDGHYLNYIQIGNKCINNSFNNREQEKELEFILKQYFDDIYWIDIQPFSKYGGGLHCLTWQF